MDTPARSLAKALSWRAVSAVITGLVAWRTTGDLRVAVAIGVLDTTIKLGAYYAHERLWVRLHFGRGRVDYEI
jgi:uncharacterized membrane protein